MIKITQDICPRCNQRITFMPHTDSFEHRCDSGIPALDQEDILNFHQTFTENGVTTNSRQNAVTALMAGVENKLQGTVGGVLGEDVENVTVRGNRVSTHRTRKHYESISLNKK